MTETDAEAARCAIRFRPEALRARGRSGLAAALAPAARQGAAMPRVADADAATPPVVRVARP